MKTRYSLFILTLLVVIVSLLGCRPPLAPTGAGTDISRAFFSVPTSLTGASGSRAFVARTLASDAWVKSSVERFYSTVRAQVGFGADVALGLRSLLLDLEEVKVAGEYLLDSQVDLQYTAPDGRKFRWTSEGGGTFFLELWAAGGNKCLELRFIKNESDYSGTAIASPAELGWTDPAGAAQNPAMIQADFNTDSDGLGTAELVLYLLDFRYHADLDPGLEDAKIILTKDAAGVVHLGSIVRAENSQHFIWNGYLMNSSNQEVLNAEPSVVGETRYYVAAGVANASNRATVHLGIPTTIDATVFTGNGIGALVQQLLADRLNNNYDFDNSASQDTTRDEGHELIGLLNGINSSTGPQLDTTTYANSKDAVFAAVDQAQGNLALLSQSNDNVDYLVDMMSVTNPAYFVESTYNSYGATVPSGWPALSDAAAQLLLPAQTDVDNLSIAFESSAAPGF